MSESSERVAAAVHDWDGVGLTAEKRSVTLLDETLRDGLQSPSMSQPGLADKIDLLRIMARIGIRSVAVGYPGMSQRAKEDVVGLLREISRVRLRISPLCVARAGAADLVAVIEAAQRGGVAVEAYIFLPASPLGRQVFGWEAEEVLRMAERWVSFAVSQDLAVVLAAEDATRARPSDLARLYQTAVRAGVRRVCITDSVGYATPVGADSVVRFVRASLDAVGAFKVGLDWHGANDRGLAVACALAAGFAGADRLHGSALGIGERVGCASMEQLIVNVARCGWAEHDLSLVVEYQATALAAFGLSERVAEVPVWQPTQQIL